MDDQTELRKRYKAWCKAVRRKERAPYPVECHDLRCGAKTRAGTPCSKRSFGDVVDAPRQADHFTS